MARHTLHYGRTAQDGNVPGDWQTDVINSEGGPASGSLENIVLGALSHPVESPALREIVNPGEKVCIVFSDITRSWQRTDLYLPLIVEELEKGGVAPKDISLLCALGTHRPHSEEEKEKLTGSLYGRYRVVDHDCDDRIIW